MELFLNKKFQKWVNIPGATLTWAVPRLLVGIHMENIQHNIHWNPVELSAELKQHNLIKRIKYWKASEHHRELWRYDILK